MSNVPVRSIVIVEKPARGVEGRRNQSVRRIKHVEQKRTGVGTSRDDAHVIGEAGVESIERHDPGIDTREKIEVAAAVNAAESERGSLKMPSTLPKV